MLWITHPLYSVRVTPISNIFVDTTLSLSLSLSLSLCVYSLFLLSLNLLMTIMQKNLHASLFGGCEVYARSHLSFLSETSHGSCAKRVM